MTAATATKIKIANGQPSISHGVLPPEIRRPQFSQMVELSSHWVLQLGQIMWSSFRQSVGST
ncbi:MAG TPA: hypothetical protein VF283_18260 [Bryobacteraceae bacterium]